MIPINYMMKISSINRTAKAFVLCAMLASSTPLIATNPIKTAKTKIMPQTEVVSRQGAEALKAIVYPQQKQDSAVPTVHNRQLDEKCLKFCDNEEEKTHMNEFLSMNYNKYGSYLGSAKIQQHIDLNMFLEFLDGNIEILKKFGPITVNGETFGKNYYEEAVKLNTPRRKEEIQNLKNNVYDWISKNYFKIYSNAFEFDHVPDYKEVLKSMDDFVENNTLEFVPGERMFYKGEGYRYHEQIELDKMMPQEKINNTHLETNYTAFRMYLLDYDLFMNMLNFLHTSDETFKMFDIYMDIAHPPKERLAY